MGYELTLYIGRVSGFTSEGDGGAAYFSIYGMVELHKPGYDSAIYREVASIINDLDRRSVYAYLRDGNYRTREDYYGAKLKALNIDDVLPSLMKDVENSPSYPPFKIATDMILSFMEWYPDMKILLFGH